MTVNPHLPRWMRRIPLVTLFTMDLAVDALARALRVPHGPVTLRPERRPNSPPRSASAVVPSQPTGAARATDPLSAVLDATATTVVAVASADAARAPAEAVDTLADLAVRHELVIVYAHPDHATAPGPQAFVERIRRRLPRFAVTAVFVDPYPHLDTTDCALLAELVADGTVPVAVVPVADPVPTVRALAGRVRADLTLRLVYDPAAGARLQTLPEPASPVPG